MGTNIKKPTWHNLKSFYSYHKTVLAGPKDEERHLENPLYEPLTRRRYNYSKVTDRDRVRIVFLNRLLEIKPEYKTLVRDGKPVWCYDLKYEGLIGGSRAFSFRLSGAKNKRFTVTERYALLVPQRVFIDHVVSARIFPRTPYSQFGAVFRYDNCREMMYNNRSEEHFRLSYREFCDLLDNDCQIKVGDLVRPRVGLFSPTRRNKKPDHGRNILERMLNIYKGKISKKDHDTLCTVVNIDVSIALTERETDILDAFLTWCMTSDEVLFPFGLVMCRETSVNDGLFGKDLYTVRFGPDEYNMIHPIELETVK